MEINGNFNNGTWAERIDVSDFVYRNITPYEGDASFLTGASERTKRLWAKCLEALAEEKENGGVRSIDNKTISTITSHAAGYIAKEDELIVGLQTDELLRRAIKPFGGWHVVEKACKENGVELDPEVKKIFTHYRKTHNDGVFDVYTEEIRRFNVCTAKSGVPIKITFILSLLFFWLLCLCIKQFPFYMLHIHNSIQMLALMADAPCQQPFSFQYERFHIFVQRFTFYIIRPGHLTHLSRKA